MSTDRGLLEAAAKAAGIQGEYECWAGQGFREGIRQVLNGAKFYRPWNPITDDGDALRLAVTLEIEVRNFNGSSHAGKNDKFWCTENWLAREGDPFSATRRAITRAAATLAKDAP